MKTSNFLLSLGLLVSSVMTLPPASYSQNAWPTLINTAPSSNRMSAPSAPIQGNVETSELESLPADLGGRANCGFGYGMTAPQGSISWLATEEDRQYLGATASIIPDSPPCLHFSRREHDGIMYFLSDAACVVGQVWSEVSTSPDPRQIVTIGTNYVLSPQGLKPPGSQFDYRVRLFSKSNQFPIAARQDLYLAPGSGTAYFQGQADFLISLSKDGTIRARQIRTIIPKRFQVVPPVIPPDYSYCMQKSLERLSGHPFMSWPTNYSKSEILCWIHCVTPKAGTLFWEPARDHL